MAKETALIAPLALLAWELICPLLPARKLAGEHLCFRSGGPALTLLWLLCAFPLACWLAYHKHVTGYVFGNPEYLRYNVAATLSPLRVGLAMLIRLWHLLGYLNLFVLTLGAIYAMCQPALLERDGSERPRIAISAQLVFAAVIAAYFVAFSVVGGAVLARYLLPGVPACHPAMRFNLASSRAPLDVVGRCRLRAIRFRFAGTAVISHFARRHAAVSQLRRAAQSCGQ